ncbi:MAG: protein kinase [Acidobacteriota bacterium]
MSATGTNRLRSIGLGTRFSLAATILLLAALGIAVAIIDWRSAIIAQQTIRGDLDRAAPIFRSYLSDLEMRLADQVHSLAGEPGTKAIFDPSVNVSTRHEFALDSVQVLAGAKTVFLFGPDAASLARSDRAEGEGVGQQFGGVAWVSEPLRTWHESTAVILEGNVLSVVAATPVVSGAGEMAHLDGVLAASFALEKRQAAALQGLTRGDIAFLVNRARRGSSPEVAVSVATGLLEAQDFARTFASVDGAVEGVFENAESFGPFEVTHAGDRLIGMAVPIQSAAGEPYGAFVVARSMAQELAAFRQIRRTLFVVGGLAILVAAPVSFLLGRRLARPLQQLAIGAGRIREGELEFPLPERAGGEIGALARAFRGMVTELKEKRALERMLVPLGRASTTNAATQVPLSEHAGRPVFQQDATVANRYRVRSVLGAGAMGTVFLADDLELEEEVALKVLSSHALGPGTSSMQSVKIEIRTARKISHPNVVRVHDLGEAQGVYFLTMEYVPGMTLRDVIEKRGALALGPGLQIAKQLCRGLAAVHDAGIIHRDIKPQNIMVLPNGTVKLMDFGIAKSERIADPLLREGALVGTPSYMSPEQVRCEPLDARSDLYAVGAVMFEMFTGSPPFSGTPRDVLDAHLHQDPPAPASLRPDLPDTLDRLIVGSMSKRPDRRPASAQDLYAALLRIHLAE